MAIRYKPLIRGMLLGIMLFTGLYGNIILHEAGHFVTAEHFNLQPKMYLFDNGTGTGFSFFNQNFYTTYDKPITQAATVDFLIALAGPLANLLLASLLVFAYLKIPKTKPGLRLAILMLLIPSIISVISNLLPAAGTDGGIVWSYLR